ncbi:hypothetical protein DPMN_037846 [Dreissena polymorpha]|uniref:Uncharacterized protein n=1 Tax=Dreissena polymorpha TaxID=45954 RepID=A0A9D4MF86_DREPO|nr:hypothetical protein DPMN_037846 [Dreissena polymorpha]
MITKHLFLLLLFNPTHFKIFLQQHQTTPHLHPFKMISKPLFLLLLFNSTLFKIFLQRHPLH